MVALRSERAADFLLQLLQYCRHRAESSEPLPEGKSTVRVEFTPEEKGYGKPAVAKLLINGRQTATVRVERTVPVGYSGEGFDVGADNISAVSPDYKSPFSFNGKIQSVTIAMEK